MLNFKATEIYAGKHQYMPDIINYSINICCMNRLL